MSKGFGHINDSTWYLIYTYTTLIRGHRRKLVDSEDVSTDPGASASSEMSEVSLYILMKNLIMPLYWI